MALTCIACYSRKGRCYYLSLGAAEWDKGPWSTDRARPIPSKISPGPVENLKTHTTDKTDILCTTRDASTSPSKPGSTSATANDPPTMPAPKPTPAKPPSSSTAYLFLYNFASSVAWATVLGRTISYNVADGPGALYPGTGEFVRWTQTAACLEVVHSLTGISPHPHQPTKPPL